jgi:hypothetical protein
VGWETDVSLTPDEAVPFAKEIGTLLEYTVEDPEMKARLLSLEEADYGILSVQVEAAASDLVHENNPTPTKLYGRILEIQAGLRGLSTSIPWTAERYPINIPRDGYECEEEYLGTVLEQGELYLAKIKSALQSIRQWLSRTTSDES